MEKKILIILSLVGLFLIMAFSYASFKKNQANQVINEMIQAYGIPEEEILVISDTTKNIKIGSYEKVVTTKKDFKNWQDKIKSDEKNLGYYLTNDKNNKEIRHKKDISDYKNCEMTYIISYDEKRRIQKMFDCNYFGTWDSMIGQSKLAKQMHYQPSKKFLAKYK